MRAMKKWIVMALAVMMVLAVAACSPKLTTQQKLDKSQEVVKDIKNLDAKMDMKIGMSAMGTDLEVTATGNIVTFKDPVKLKLEMTLGMLGQNQELKLYAVEDGEDYKVYTFESDEWSADTVTKEDFEEETSVNTGAESVDLYIKNMTEIKEEGEEEIDGRKTQKITGVITGDKMAEVLKANGTVGSILGEVGVSEDEDALSSISESITATLWLDAATYAPVKIELDMGKLMDKLVKMSMGADDDSEDSIGVSTCVVSITYNKINDAVDFTIPQDALDAE
jgi:hypothetical protein